MGTYYEWVADLDATEDDAPEVGRRVVEALVARGVILPELSPDAALGGDGHPAGPAWADTVEASASGESPWGVEVRVGRSVQDGGQFDVGSVTCPRCSATREFFGPPEEFGPTCSDEEGLGQFYAAAEAWSEGDADGGADLECRSCGVATPVVEWRAGGAALTCLAFVFWGWDELRPEALRWVAEATGGHRIASGSGKI
ncbi:hypothetical protein [Promicromonospora sp. NPDC060271]|uniref:hypothetical protein n=1 Tax=Promicromonospora sp. NPDC060271 TaxID=3347089 RepID=UPI0036602BFD